MKSDFPQIGSLFAEKYRVLAAFKGAMGAVFKVQHVEWDILLAMKCPLPNLLQNQHTQRSFQHECDLWINLGLHPHIATCYYLRRLQHHTYVFAEFVEGGTLREWIMTHQLYRGGEEIAFARMLDVAIQTAWALDYAHKRQFVHQDVKPGNILMSPDGTAKLTDFGLARAARVAGQDAQSRAFAEFAGGTPAYWSPEQEKRMGVTAAADVWSWGLSILEMFTGGFVLKSGVQAKAHLAAFRERALLKARGLPKMPESLYEILRNCFRSDPQSRPSDLGDVAARLIDIYKEVHHEEYSRPTPDLSLVAADSLNNRAVSLLDLGQKEKAMPLLTEALAIDPAHPEATFNRALILFRNGKRSAANVLAKLEAIAPVNIGNWSVDCLVARMCIEIGDRAKAMNALERAEQKIASETQHAEIAKIRTAATAGPLKAWFGRNKQPFVLAVPLSGADHAHDYQKMLRLIKKAEAAHADGREYDVKRYIEQLQTLPGFARHPKVRRLLRKV
ncbi:MAG TPA: protein kinase [Chthoniobacterales bacterium]|nr:protein kinase [Chthoniobacterales bacterium]